MGPTKRIQKKNKCVQNISNSTNNNITQLSIGLSHNNHAHKLDFSKMIICLNHFDDENVGPVFGGV